MKNNFLRATVTVLLRTLATIGAVLVLSVVVLFARRAGMIDGDLTIRLLMVVPGAVFVLFANGIPKAAFRASARTQQTMRIAGWSMTLGALGYTLSWAFAPIAYALALSMALLGAGAAFAIGYCVLMRRPTTPA